MDSNELLSRSTEDGYTEYSVPPPKNKKKKTSKVVGAGENGTLVACIKRKRSTIEDKDSASNSIPTQVIFNILLLLPASILRDIMRFVCKEWNAIISDPFFIRAHFYHSLSSSSSHADTGLHFLVQGNDLHDANLKRAFYFHSNADAHDGNGTGYSWSRLKLPFEANILGSCNGLVLLKSALDKKSAKDLFVANLVTKAMTRLPSLAGVFIIYQPYTALAFATSSGKYKVVYVSLVSQNGEALCVSYPYVKHLSTRFEVKVLVCTIGVDKTWRAIDIKGITMSDEVKRTLLSEPLSNSSSGAGGRRHIYWFNRSHSYGLALDVDAETMYEFAGPKGHWSSNLSESIWTETDKGVGVGMVHLQDPCKHWKVWELMEPKTWGQVTDIDVAYMYSALKSRFNRCRQCCLIKPVLFSSKRGELWVIFVVDAKFRFACYNWKTGNVWSPPITWPSYIAIPHLHVNSLLSVEDRIDL